MTAAAGPVVPNFGQASSCVVDNGWFCTNWVSDHWGDTLQPALLQHLHVQPDLRGLADAEGLFAVIRAAAQEQARRVGAIGRRSVEDQAAREHHRHQRRSAAVPAIEIAQDFHAAVQAVIDVRPQPPLQ